jgi:hypothetical protein
VAGTVAYRCLLGVGRGRRYGWLYADGGVLVWQPDWNRTAQVLNRPVRIHPDERTTPRRFQELVAVSAAGASYQLAVPAGDVDAVSALGG